MGPFAIGQPVDRKEDPILLRGEGSYAADVSLPGQAWAVFVRSRYAHGLIQSIETAEAAAMPGVLGVYTQAELTAAGLQPMPPAQAGKNHDGTPTATPVQTVLAGTKVRYVGDPVAFVVAETLQQARDAAEAVIVEIEPLPAVTTPGAAVAPGAPLVHDNVPGNVVQTFRHGDAKAVADAFARAAHVTKLTIRNSRIVVAQMEPRSAVGQFEPEVSGGKYTIHMGCQGVFGQRNTLRRVMAVGPEQLRVLTRNVGGSFGMKSSVYPEYPSILHAARVLGRPVKWTDDRGESFVSDSHGRDHEATVSLALDADGKFLAVRAETIGAMGAYMSNAVLLPATVNTMKNIIGVYATPLMEIYARNVFTHTTPVGAYRGAGRPEGNYYMERLIDTAAREMGIDRVELRRRNHIQPEQLPYAAPSAQSYDSGAFPAVLDAALARADWDGYGTRRAESRRRGKIRGRGIGQYLEATAPSGEEMGGIRFEADGSVTIVTGTLDYGQGHSSAFAQVLSAQLGIPFEKINLLQGDSDELIAGGGTGGSRSIMASGTAILAASEQVVEHGRKIAGHLLEVSAADIEFSEGRFSIAGTDRGIDILDLATRLREGHIPSLPADLPASLNVELIHKTPPSAFPNGCHVAEIEIDPETGVTSIERYETVNDFGVLINPKLVQGQLHGGIMQGLGQALMEEATYDADGQIVTGSFMDYAMPRADNGVTFGFVSQPSPARTNALGVKGCGEAGCAGSLPAIMNAVVDALSEFGIDHIDMPATPWRVWEAISKAQG
jgi:carbon-monoxide dehydrogenase large subunit